MEFHGPGAGHPICLAFEEDGHGSRMCVLREDHMVGQEAETEGADTEGADIFPPSFMWSLLKLPSWFNHGTLP